MCVPEGERRETETAPSLRTSVLCRPPRRAGARGAHARACGGRVPRLASPPSSPAAGVSARVCARVRLGRVRGHACPVRGHRAAGAPRAAFSRPRPRPPFLPPPPPPPLFPRAKATAGAPPCVSGEVATTPRRRAGRFFRTRTLTFHFLSLPEPRSPLGPAHAPPPTPHGTGELWSLCAGGTRARGVRRGRLARGRVRRPRPPSRPLCRREKTLASSVSHPAAVQAARAHLAGPHSRSHTSPRLSLHSRARAHPLPPPPGPVRHPLPSLAAAGSVLVFPADVFSFPCAPSFVSHSGPAWISVLPGLFAAACFVRVGGE